MAKWSVKMNGAGARNILNSNEVQNDLLKRAQRMKARADSFDDAIYSADVQPGRTRAHAMVKTTDIVSIRSNAKNNSLLKSVDAGRG